MHRTIVEFCVLRALEPHPLHAYGVVTLLAAYPALAFGEGTVYPLLARLERSGLLHSQKTASVRGPKRREYQLTPQGVSRLRELEVDWRAIASAVQALKRPRHATG